MVKESLDCQDLLAQEHLERWTEHVDEIGFDLIRKVLGDYRHPDLLIAPDGKPYIYRWHVIPRNEVGANVYLHLQVADDPERPLHDHPWDNQSVVLTGGYREVFVRHPESHWHEVERQAYAGRVVARRAEEAHRIFLLPDHPYSLNLFTTGPVIRKWGFWFLGAPQGTLIPRRWREHDECIDAEGRFIGDHE